MVQFVRSGAALDAEIAGSADAAWALLTDWAGILRWWPSNPPVVIENVVLEGAPDAVPRGRRIFRGGGSAVETLLKADPVARRIYYDLSEGGIPVLRNYMATTMIDPIDAGRCRMRFSSHFDAAEGEEETAKQIVIAVYSAIRDGFNAYFQAAAQRENAA